MKGFFSVLAVFIFAAFVLSMILSTAIAFMKKPYKEWSSIDVGRLLKAEIESYTILLLFLSIIAVVIFSGSFAMSIITNIIINTFNL